MLTLSSSEAIHETTWPSTDPTEKPLYIPAKTRYRRTDIIDLITTNKRAAPHTVFLSCIVVLIYGDLMVFIDKCIRYNCRSLTFN